MDLLINSIFNGNYDNVDYKDNNNNGNDNDNDGSDDTAGDYNASDGDIGKNTDDSDNN